MQPIFMDFEASSLNKDSYPIEVAWSDEQGRVESYFIKPEISWNDWDGYAEHEIHGISREQLLEEGLSVEWVIGRMRGRLKDKIVYVDGGQFDVIWCERLFDYKGHSGRLPFVVQNFNDLLVKEFGVWTVINKDVMSDVKSRVRYEVGGQHRAAIDVRYLQGVYRELKMLTKGER
jgi:hypothetical protein